MSSNFGVNRFQRDVNRAVKRIGQEESRKLAQSFERSMNGLSRSQEGKPVSQVKSRIRAEFQRLGVKATDREIEDYARAVAAGDKFKVEHK